jgi:hypothetical protein
MFIYFMVFGNSDTKRFKFRDVVRGLEDSNTEPGSDSNAGIQKTFATPFVLLVRPLEALKEHFRPRRMMR